LVRTLSGELVPPAEYVKAQPHPDYIAFAARLRQLGTGRHADRAGDVLLLAHNGGAQAAADRYYFASLYRSWHGSPSRQDSEIPFIVAHQLRSSAELCDLVGKSLGSEPKLSQVAPLLLRLRSGGSAR
jgi:hypothetical protein